MLCLRYEKKVQSVEKNTTYYILLLQTPLDPHSLTQQSTQFGILQKHDVVFVS